MHNLCLERIRLLTEKREGPHISIFMPSRSHYSSQREYIIRFEDLIQKSEEGLASWNLKAQESKNLLEPSKDLIQNSVFWSRQSGGLAFFLASQFFSCYHLPLALTASIVISNRFYVMPLIKLGGSTYDYRPIY